MLKSFSESPIIAVFSLHFAGLFQLFSLPAVAHDFWIEPSSFQLRSGDRVGLYLRVGERFDGTPLVFPTARIKHFSIDDATQRRTVAPLPRDPAGIIQVLETGLQVVSFENTPSYIELPAEQFTTYLQAEGLEEVLTARRRANANDLPAKESYSRCAKALLWVDGDETGKEGRHYHDKPVGLTLEILPEKNPYRLKAPATLAVHLLYEGKPVAGVLVMALNKGAPNEVQHIRSNLDGRADFTLRRSGPWLVKAVHMVPAEWGTSEEWRSYWATLTFELPSE